MHGICTGVSLATNGAPATHLHHPRHAQPWFTTTRPISPSHARWRTIFAVQKTFTSPTTSMRMRLHPASKLAQRPCSRAWTMAADTRAPWLQPQQQELAVPHWPQAPLHTATMLTQERRLKLKPRIRLLRLKCRRKHETRPRTQPSLIHNPACTPTWQVHPWRLSATQPAQMHATKAATTISPQCQPHRQQHLSPTIMTPVRKAIRI